MTNTNRPVSDINPVAPTERSPERSDALNSNSLKSSPSTDDSARPDLNSPATESHRVPDMTEAGDHLAATSAGTVGGAAVGATLGMIGGPPGAVVGGLIGGVVGGLAGVMTSHNLPIQKRKTITGESSIKIDLISMKLVILIMISTMTAIIVGLIVSVMKTVPITTTLIRLNLTCVLNGNRLRVNPV